MVEHIVMLSMILMVYFCEFCQGLVACDMASITVNPAVASVKTALLVDGEKPGVPTNLSVGRTKVNIQVTSADESTVQVNLVRYITICNRDISTCAHNSCYKLVFESRYSNNFVIFIILLELLANKLII